MEGALKLRELVDREAIEGVVARYAAQRHKENLASPNATNNWIRCNLFKKKNIYFLESKGRGYSRFA